VKVEVEDASDGGENLMDVVTVFVAAQESPVLMQPDNHPIKKIRTG
jgi:hypothetical protein